MKPIRLSKCKLSEKIVFWKNVRLIGTMNFEFPTFKFRFHCNLLFDSCDSGKCPVDDSCEYAIEPQFSLKDEEFAKYLSNCKFHKKSPASWSWFVRLTHLFINLNISTAGRRALLETPAFCSFRSSCTLHCGMKSPPPTLSARAQEPCLIHCRLKSLA